MKLLLKTIILLNLFFSFSPTSAAEKLIIENRIWEYTSQRGYKIWIEHFQFDGTELRSDKTYNRWKQIDRVSWSEYPSTAPVTEDIDSVVALLREDNGKVFMLLEDREIRNYNSGTKVLSAPYKDPTQEVVLYDFNATKDDIILNVINVLWFGEHPDDSQLTISKGVVKDIHPIDVRDNHVNEYMLQPDVYVALLKSLGGYDFYNMLHDEIMLDGKQDPGLNINSQSMVKYAEVVGNTGNGKLTSIMPIEPIFLTSGMMEIETCYLSCVFDTDGTIVYGTPAGINKLDLDNSQSDSNGMTFDLHGRPVSTPLPGSVYIRDGKKFIGK